MIMEMAAREQLT